MKGKKRLNEILKNHATSFPDKVSEAILREFTPKTIYDKDRKLLEQLGYIPLKDSPKYCMIYEDPNDPYKFELFIKLKPEYEEEK